MEDEAIIICATEADAAILSSTPLIELIGGSSLRVKTAKAETTAAPVPGAREVIVFWYAN